MRDSHHAHRARQQPAKMLQSVAYLVGAGKTVAVRCSPSLRMSMKATFWVAT
jgi:hypothetical protein